LGFSGYPLPSISIIRINVTVVDSDTVDFKNLSYQNFIKTDVMESKAVVMRDRYKFKAYTKRVMTDEDLIGYDCIISAVDNSHFRKLLYSFSDKYPNVYWIDLRSEGRTCAAYTKSKKTNYKFMMDTLPKIDVDDGSCQLTYELTNGIVQGGNRIIAQIGAQLVLNWFRSEPNPPTFSFRF